MVLERSFGRVASGAVEKQDIMVDSTWQSKVAHLIVTESQKRDDRDQGPIIPYKDTFPKT